MASFVLKKVRNYRMASSPRCQCSKKCTNPPIKNQPFCIYHTSNGCPFTAPTSGSEPDNNILDDYNNDPSKRRSHNCYSFAAMVHDLKKIAKCASTKDCDISFHSPGSASGQGRVKEKHCAVIIGRTMGDFKDSELATFNQKCPRGFSKIAVVTDDKNDFHYYLQLKNGKWAHKPGGTAATLLDSNDSEIYNPQLAGRYYPPDYDGDHELNYKNFCGYLCVNRSKPATIKGGRSRGKGCTKKRSKN